ncbi:hypothetical protein UFOVP413_3 [uncultured Caudovirales phage]|uniref:Uncharacterized protein n=1 Tax=uncultured Caudovirales phage TaxID=2100421 RepID=A0A6J5M6A0_9CAUD|nr:hypothetical protein UFOVP413_3 [uncultured Caudovirales phage]
MTPTKFIAGLGQAQLTTLWQAARDIKSPNPETRAYARDAAYAIWASQAVTPSIAKRAFAIMQDHDRNHPLPNMHNIPLEHRPLLRDALKAVAAGGGQ